MDNEIKTPTLDLRLDFDTSDSIAISSFLMKFREKAARARKVAKDYGTGQLLYPAEVHLLRLIWLYPEKNITELSQILGVTKMSVSAQTSKLRQKKLIEPYHRSNQKEIHFRLSELGQTVVECHEEYHKKESPFITRMLQVYSQREIDLILSFLVEYMESMDSYSHDKSIL